MSLPKWIAVGTVLLFGTIGVTALFKKKEKTAPLVEQLAQEPLVETQVVSVPQKAVLSEETRIYPLPKDDFPNIDRVFQLFSLNTSKLPIVETVGYTSSVPWLKGRPAWVADYAVHYNTSRHFIARSLNGRSDYFSQKVVEGSRFNVFRKDKKIQFHLLIDISRCKMGFYYVDLDTNERVLLKTYSVGLGRLEGTKNPSSLTPVGDFTLGDRVAIYKPGTMGTYQNQKVEMIRIFGTRWIPFGEKGLGFKGAPWVEEEKTSQLVEVKEVVGAYRSDGCVQLCKEDLEELFAIVITKPTFVHIVKDFHEAKLPGVEVAAPSR